MSYSHWHFFRKHLKVLDEKLNPEGKSFLSSELEKTLDGKGYTREDLLTRSVFFTCGKRNM